MRLSLETLFRCLQPTEGCSKHNVNWLPRLATGFSTTLTRPHIRK
jgi:hypothetical protein